MVVFTRSTRKTSSSIDDRLYSLTVTIRQTRQCDITIVNSTLDRMNAVIRSVLPTMNVVMNVCSVYKKNLTNAFAILSIYYFNKPHMKC